MRRLVLLIALGTLGSTIAIPAADAGAATRVRSHVTMTRVTRAAADTPKPLVAWVHGRQPSGTVKFTVNGRKACAAKVMTRRRASVGRASCRAKFGRPGTFRLRAAYSGNARNKPSAATRRLRVAKAASRLQMFVTRAYLDEPDVMPLWVASPDTHPKGRVTVFINGKKFAALKVQDVTGTGPTHRDSGQVVLFPVFRKLGVYKVRIVYSGDAILKPSAIIRRVRVFRDPDTVGYTYAMGTTFVGKPVRLTAQVWGQGPGNVARVLPAPTGTVWFKWRGKTVCSTKLTVVPGKTPAAKGSCDWTPTTHLYESPITEVYGGDGIHAATTYVGYFSDNQDPTATSVKVPATVSFSAGSMKLAATVTAPYETPGGTVTFSENGVALCTTAPLSGGSGSCAAPIPANTNGGTTQQFTITATYSGDPNDVKSVGTASLTVNY